MNKGRRITRIPLTDDISPDLYDLIVGAGWGGDGIVSRISNDERVSGTSGTHPNRSAQDGCLQKFEKVGLAILSCHLCERLYAISRVTSTFDRIKIATSSPCSIDCEASRRRVTCWIGRVVDPTIVCAVPHKTKIPLNRRCRGYRWRASNDRRVSRRHEA